MKIILIAVLAVLPASVSAQAVTGTLEMVQSLSLSAGSNTDLAAAKIDAARPFSAAVLAPQGGQHGGPQHPGSNPPGHVTPGNNPGNHGGNDNHGGNNNPGNHGGNDNHGGNPGNHGGNDNHGGNPGNHQNPPVIIVNPPHPYQPGYNDPFHPGYNDPYGPGHNGGYYPSGPSHETTTPVVSTPMSKTTMIIIGVAVVALVLLLILV